ncbi:hypothetical protein [Palleronia pelagia]|uniref:SPW repeat-containing protein n=1 Tax=Palleronia pelagia TaxID=387096 RepID=A0A1H8BQM9_9RHOB|nr:hypothetical protein [Palleronia pelagia]SEM84424.1 hypothetical protein SAMN04488011_101669 [Palleronia pelagia]
MFHPTPWHFWPVLTIALIWHLFGVIDYTATQLDLAFWMSMATDAQRAFVSTMPDWIDAVWAISVWAGLAGVILMAMRTGFAPLILAASFIATLILTIWLAISADPSLVQLVGPVGVWVMVGATVLSLILWLWARAMHQEGVID